MREAARQMTKGGGGVAETRSQNKERGDNGTSHSLKCHRVKAAGSLFSVETLMREQASSRVVPHRQQMRVCFTRQTVTRWYPVFRLHGVTASSVSENYFYTSKRQAGQLLIVNC